jgi:hypothetical protein
MATNETYELERKRTKATIDYVLKALSGDGNPLCLDQEPTRKFSVGILSPQPPEDSSGKTSNRRKPTSLGFEATLQHSSSPTLSINIEFSVYWRALPSWQEQLDIVPETIRKNLSSSEGETRLRLKYCREDIKVGPVELEIRTDSLEGATSLDTTKINTAIQKEIDEVKERVVADERCWPSNTKELAIPNSSLETEEKYDSYIKTHYKQQKTAERPAWTAKFTLKLWPQDSKNSRIAALLSNAVDESNESKHPLALVSSEFTVEPRGGIFISYPFAAAALDYRYESVSWGRGINCVLTVTEAGKQAKTQTTPIYYQPRTITRAEMNEACSFNQLSGDKMFSSLDRVGDWLESYAKKWQEDNHRWTDDTSYTNRVKDLGAFEEEITRFRRGIHALQDDERLAHAFKLANQAFSKGAHAEWRLFQLVFVVSQMTSLLAREKPTEELLEVLNRVDVLWFPTGGGKTEAYFGVIAVALFYDRLRGKDRGVTAWLRYPLRMLSIQQLQRLMEIVVYADIVRQGSSSPLLHNGGPFTLGYYVGEKNTPNSLTSVFHKPPNKSLLEQKQRVEEASSPDENPLLVLQRCPFCRSTNLGVQVIEDEVRIKHVCNSCSKELPIFITDTEIYRYAPSIIVGTVDRLARAGQTSHFAHLFGRFNKACPDHGYLSFDECLEKGVCKRKVNEYIDIPELYDPTPCLLLQDELHLLRESLGTYDSHYETFIDTLADSIGKKLPPKRLAATATIEGFEKHTQELYARDAVRFPVKGMLENESAYVMPSPAAPIGREYVGILPTGSDTKEVVYGILSALKAFSDEQHKIHGASKSDSDKLLASNYDLSLAYVNQKNTAGDLRAYWNDPHEIQVLTGDRGLAEVRATIGRVESDIEQPFADRLKFLVATSVISHGVDLERLNFMSFAGMPATASDYIQASSRVGRTHVGVVFTVFRPENNRERNVYQRFYEYHERLYQLVQPIPINRVSQSAISRTITGILSACILNILGYEKGLQLGGFDKAKVFKKALNDGLVSDKDLIDLARKSLGIDKVQLPGDSLALIDEHIFRLVKDERRLMLSEEGYSTYRLMRPYPVSSLREVSEQIGFALNYPAAQIVTQLQQRKVEKK